MTIPANRPEQLSGNNIRALKETAMLNIRNFVQSDTEDVMLLWNACGLLKDWNNPLSDIDRKMSYQPELFFIGALDDQLMASAMFGYDGHRGWLYYFAVSPNHQNKGYGKQILLFGEEKLVSLGCPKINLQVREGNSAEPFYEVTDYKKDKVISFGKRLIVD